MPLARSPPDTRSRSRRPAGVEGPNTPIAHPPPVSTPEGGLGPPPPATPVRTSQPFVQPPKIRGKGKNPVVEAASPVPSPDSSSEDDNVGNSTVTVERGRRRTRPSSMSSDPALYQLLKALTEAVTTPNSTSTSTGATSFKTPAMKAPDAFDGNPTKLRNFLQSCQLIFYNDEKTFFKDKKKVVYASSFLTGKAGKWIEPFLAHIDNEEPSYLLNSWKDFESQLFTLFGDPNEVRKAEKDLDNLQMKEGSYASSYITDFRTLTTKISDWGERALMYHFRKGLPSRLLDQLAVHQAPLDSLQDLMSATLDYDTRFHERTKEKKFTTSTPSTSTHVKEKMHSIDHKKPTRSKNFKTSKPVFRDAKPSQKDIPSHLNTDWTLKNQEKERRVKGGLCTYCGEKHKIEDCRKLKKKNELKGKAPVKA